MTVTYRKFLLSLLGTIGLVLVDLQGGMSEHDLIGVGISGVGNALVLAFSNGPDVRAKP